MIDFSAKDLLFLAPLAGYTDLPFRSVVKEFGVDVTVSEMISSNALVYKSQKTFQMLQRSPNETPYIVQISGSDPKTIKDAILILNDIDYIDGIDLNCGCPVPKVVKQGSGSALLKDLSHMSKVIQTIKKHSNKRYLSVKTRTGFSKKQPKEIAMAVQESGADYITMHGRTRSAGYKTKEIDYDSIASAKSILTIPLVANGDVDSFSKYKEVKNITGADAVMIGRAAVGNPWIFYQIKNSLDKVSKDKVKELVLEHFNKMVDIYQNKAVSIFRKHLHNYSKNYPSASIFRDRVNRSEDPHEIQRYIKEFF
jgi:tRNA-dihydrouridine synthase B